MIEEKYDLKEFNYELIMKECETKKTIEEQIKYLRYVLMEWRLNPPRLDPNGEIVPCFEKRLELQIHYREETQNGKHVAVTGEKIVWAKKREDFVALLDVLMNLNFILPKREKNIMLSDHFTWMDEEMTSEHLRQTRNGIKNKPELYKLSLEMEKIVNVFKLKN